MLFLRKLSHACCLQPVKLLTEGLSRLYQRLNPAFPRLMTRPSVPMSNEGCDNADGNLIMSVNDVLMADRKTKPPARCACLLVHAWCLR